MVKSESIKNLAKALSEFQGEIKNPLNTADNPFFKSKYAPLNEILNGARPLLKKNGLSLLQSPSGDGSNIIINAILMHESGEWIEAEPLVLKADKATAQGAGSAITYARRYQVSAILGISSEDDDDGNGAEPQSKDNKTKPKTDTPATPPAAPANIECITEAQQKRMFAMSKGNTEAVKTILTAHGYEHSKDVKKSDYENICKEIEAKVKA